MQLLLTRPYQDSFKTQTILEKKGHICFIEPLSEIIFHHHLKQKIIKISAIKNSVILTSKNAVDALSAMEFELQFFKNYYCIGSKISEKLLNLGINDQNIHILGENIEEFLTNFKNKNIDFFQFIYLSGESITQELEFTANNTIIKIDRLPIYDTKFCENLSDDTQNKISQSEIDGVLFYSTLNAQHFEKLINKHQLENYIYTMNAYCLSQKIADSLHLSWNTKIVSDSSNEESFLKYF